MFVVSSEMNDPLVALRSTAAGLRKRHADIYHHMAGHRYLAPKGANPSKVH